MAAEDAGFSQGSVGSGLHRLCEAILTLSLFRKKVSHNMGSRHAVTRPADGLPDATESHRERADPVGGLARLRTSLASRTPTASTVVARTGLGRRHSKRKMTDAGADQPYGKLREMKTRRHGPAVQYWSGTVIVTRRRGQQQQQGRRAHRMDARRPGMRGQTGVSRGS
jgi:hypothetical protein